MRAEAEVPLTAQEIEEVSQHLGRAFNILNGRDRQAASKLTTFWRWLAKRYRYGY